MKNKASVLLLLLLFTVTSVSAQDIKIMAFNIHGGSSLDPDPIPPSGKDVKIRNTAAAINAAAPDIAILEEVDNFTTWAGNMHQSDSLANLTGMYSYFGRQRYTAGINGEAGILMLSKYPIIEKMVFPLPSADISLGIPRALVIIGVEIKGQRVYVVGAHFDNDPANRMVQAIATVKVVNSLRYPVIFGGDLNDFVDSAPITKLSEALIRGCKSCPLTMRWDNPNRTIDYVMFNSKMLEKYSVSSYETFFTNSSDHMPVLVRLSSKKSENLLGWQFSNPNTSGTEASIPATYVSSSLETSILTRGAGLNNTKSLSRGFAAGANFESGASLVDTSIAIDKKMYFAFDVKVKSGKKLSLNSIYYKARITSGGANTWYWMYSLDNVNFQRITIPNRLTAATDTEGVDQPDVALSNIPSMQNITSGTTIYFRVYVAGSNTASGSSGFGRSSTDTNPNNNFSLCLRGRLDDIAFKPIIAWQFGTPASVGSEQNQVASLVAEGLTSSILKRGPGLSTINADSDTISYPRAFVATSIIGTSATSAADTAAAVLNKLYFSFKVSTLYGYQVSLSKLRARVRASAGGAKNWYWKYSLDGVIYNKLAEPYYNASTTAGVQLPDIDLSAIKALQGIPPGKTVYLRLYIQGANATTSSSGIGISATGTADDYVLDIGGEVERYNAAPILAWQFYNPQTSGNETFANSTITAAGLEVSKLKRGNGFRTTTAGGSPVLLQHSFVGGAKVPSVGSSYADTTVAIANNLYFAFEVKPITDHKVSLSNINARVRSSSGGAELWYWKYSLDNVSFQKLDKPYINSNTSADGIQQHQVDLSNIGALQNVPAAQTIYFRLYMQGSNSDTGSSGLGKSRDATDYVLAIGGKVEKVLGIKPIVAWQFATPESQGGEIEQPSTITADGFSPSILSRGAGLRNTAPNSGSSLQLLRTFAAGANISSNANSKADTAVSVANNQFFSYEIRMLPGYKVSLSKLNAKVRASADGAKTWYWKYCLIPGADKAKFNKLAEPYYVAATGEGIQMPEIDLSGRSNLQNLAFGQVVYLRLYVQGSNSTSATTSIGRSVSGTADDYVLNVDGVVTETLPLSTSSLPPENIIPVQLMSFSGKENLNSINLNWQTASESDNSHFEIWRITPGKSPEVLETVKGHKGSDRLNFYSLYDYNYSPGTNYYRLNLVDSSGKQRLSDVISVKAGSTNPNMKVSAQQDLITVFISAVATERGTLSLYDLEGKRRDQLSVDLIAGQNTFSFRGNYQSGIYIVRLVAKSGSMSKKTLLMK